MKRTRRLPLALDAAVPGLPEPRHRKPSESSASRCRCTLWRSVQDGHAEGGIGTERTAAQGGLGELVRLAEVLAGVRVVDAVVEARRAEGVPGIDAERAAEGRARLQHFRLAAQVAHRGELLGCRPVAEGHPQDADRGEARPVRGVVRVASEIARHAELRRRRAEGRLVPDFPDEGIRGVVDQTPPERISDLLRIERRHQRTVLLRVQHDGALPSGAQVRHRDVKTVLRRRGEPVDVTVSPECMTSGWLAVPFVSMALNAAVSWKTPGVPVWVSLKTGEQALYEPGTFFTTNPPCGVQFVTTEFG